MGSKDKKTLKEDFESRNFNLTSVINVVKYSLNGVLSYARDGKSIILYTIGFLIELFLGFIFNIDGKEWILIICMLGVLLAVELLNTAIEKCCDAITLNYNPNIKIAKDCGSGATFIIFIIMIFLNIVIFYPKIILLF